MRSKNLRKEKASPMFGKSDHIAPDRATTVLRGRRYQLRAPIDFTPVEWLEFNRAYEQFIAATEPAELSERSLLLMPQIFHYGDQAVVKPRRRWLPFFRRPRFAESGPDARAIMASTFGERLRALQDFTWASSGSGLGTTSRPMTTMTASPSDR